MRVPAIVLLLVLTPSALAASITAQDNGSGGGPGYRFVPNRIVVAPGEVVALADTGSEPHTFSPVTKDAWTDVTLQPGQNGTLTAPMTPGEYKFYCKFHASPDADPASAMAGVLVVQAAGTETKPKAAPAGAALMPLALVAAALFLRRRA